jgi:predicted chitinase
VPNQQAQAVPNQTKKTDNDIVKRNSLQKTVTPNTTLMRDDKGRFLPKSQQPNQTDIAENNAKEANKSNRIVDAIKLGISNARNTDTQGIDPAIDAMKEASAPFIMAGGAIKTASSLFSRKDKQSVAIPQITRLTKLQTEQNTTQNRDWRSFFKRFDLFAKNQSVFNKAADKTLKEIEKKPIAQGASGQGASISIGNGFGIKNVLKKLPVIGALLGGLFASSAISDTENDDTLTRKEKDKANGKTIGGVSGMLAGAAAGAALGSVIPIVGTIIGGIAGAFFGGSAGELLGETVGGWVNDLRGSDIAGNILSSWDIVSTSALNSFDNLSKGARESFTQIADKFTPVIDSLTTFFDSISTGFSGALDSLNGWVKNLTGVDVGAKLKSGYESVKSYVKDSPVGKTAGYVTDKATSAYEKTKDFFTGDSKARKQALESEMTKSGITNTNERAMIMAQADHESGGFLHNEESFKYRTPEQLMKVSKTARDKGADAVQAALNGGAESTAELMYGGRMGNTEKGDGYKYRGRGAFQLTGKDNYKQASNDLGIDLVNNPDLAMDKDVSAKLAVWYAKKNKIAQASQAGNVEAVTQKVNGGQNGIDDRKSLFAKYGGVEGVAVAENTEKSDIASLNEKMNTSKGNNPTLDTQAAVVSSGSIATPNIPMPTAPTIPSFSASDIPPAPSITEALNSPSAIKVKVEQPDVMSSRDVPDRAYAHIITGGISCG